MARRTLKVRIATVVAAVCATVLVPLATPARADSGFSDYATVSGNSATASTWVAPPPDLLGQCGALSGFPGGYQDVSLTTPSPFNATIVAGAVAYVGAGSGTITAGAGACVIVTVAGINLVNLDTSVKVVFGPGVAAQTKCSLNLSLLGIPLHLLSQFANFTCDLLNTMLDRLGKFVYCATKLWLPPSCWGLGGSGAGLRGAGTMSLPDSAGVEGDIDGASADPSTVGAGGPDGAAPTNPPGPPAPGSPSDSSPSDSSPSDTSPSPDSAVPTAQATGVTTEQGEGS